jgi:ribosomal-protein-alanine N-acetyltransferase
MITLTSDRLIMRNYRESDLANYHKMMSDKANMYWLIELTTKTVEESQKSMEFAMEMNAKGKMRLRCVALKESDRLIGAVGCEIPSKTPAGHIVDPMAWFIMPEYQNKGYITEAVKRVMEYEFLEEGCVRIVTAGFKDNAPTIKVMQKAGFRKEAEKIKARWYDGEMRDKVEYAINRDEFMQMYNVK